MPLRASSHPGSPNSPSCSALPWYSWWPGLSPWGESWKRTRVARTAALTRYRYATQPTSWLVRVVFVVWVTPGGSRMADCPLMALYKIDRRASSRLSCSWRHPSPCIRPVTLTSRWCCPVTNRAARPWTLSTRLMWFAWCGSHALLAYSSTGRTSVMYAVSLVLDVQP